MKILLCGECYSPNLGDAVIAKALRQALVEIGPDFTVALLDLSGRTRGSSGMSVDRVVGISAVFRRVNRRMSRASTRYAAWVNALRYGARRITNRVGRRQALALRDCDLLIVGGGQLLQDNRLAFPLAISSLVKLAQRAEVPVCFFSVGVGPIWSRRGKKLIDAALTADNVTSIFCRDEVSAQRIRDTFPRAADKTFLTVDAALALVVDDLPRGRRERHVGLGVIHPAVINRHCPDNPCANEDKAVQFWIDLYDRLKRTGMTVQFFTNGAPEDQRFAEALQDLIHDRSDDSPRQLVVSRVETAQDLIGTISQFAVIVAHRLHANVIAHVVGIPCVALGWDDKVEGFMDYAGRGEWYIGPQGEPADIANRVDSALHAGGVSTSASELARRVHSDLRMAVELNSRDPGARND